MKSKPTGYQPLHQVLLQKENQHVLRLLSKTQIEDLIADLIGDYEEQITVLLNQKPQP